MEPKAIAINPCWCCHAPPNEPGSDHPWPCTCIDAQICVKDGCWRCYAHCEHEEPENFGMQIQGWLTKVGEIEEAKWKNLVPASWKKPNDFHVTPDTDPELFEPDLSWLDSWRYA